MCVCAQKSVLIDVNVKLTVNIMNVRNGTHNYWGDKYCVKDTWLYLGNKSPLVKVKERL